MLRIVGATLAALLLTACAPSTLSGGPSSGHLRTDDIARPQGTIPQPVQQSVSLPRPKATVKTETYSVVVNNYIDGKQSGRASLDDVTADKTRAALMSLGLGLR